jgi:hypothetical protein
MRTSPDEIIIALSDFKRLFVKLLPDIKKAAFIGAAFLFFYLLLQEPRFVAEATFKQATPIHETGFQLKDLFQLNGGNSSQETGASVLLTSRKVLRDAVEELGMQVRWDRHFRLTRLLGRVAENVGIEMGCSLGDQERFVFEKVRYDGEREKTIFIKMVDQHAFKLFDQDRKELGKWNLGEKVSLPFFTGVLTKPPSSINRQSLYRLTLLPWTGVVNSARKRLTVKALKDERRFYQLKFADRDRSLAMRFLDQAMTSCQKVIRDENEEIAAAQLGYLEKRQEELARKWDGALQDHVAYLKGNLSQGGCLSFSQELDSLQGPQQDYSSRLLNIDFELNKLESQEEKSSSSDLSVDLEKQLSFSAEKDSSALEEQKKEVEIRLLALECDEKRLTEIEDSQVSSDVQTAIAAEIESLSHQEEKAAQLLKELESGQPLSTTWQQMSDSKSLIATWAKQIALQQQQTRLSEQKKSEFTQEKEQVAAFIAQTANRIKILRDNLVVHGSRDHEFEGLTLETAQRLYLDYNSERDGLQAQLKQLVYLSEQLYQPSFELSSITTILSDPVTQGLVLQAGETAVRLQDANNRSQREQDHLKEMLNTQKSFIAQHLLQIIELTKLRVRLTEEKIGSLRKTTIGLLGREKELLQRQLDQIAHKMGDLPDKWRRENLLLLKKEMGVKMIEGLAHFMETKNIDRHLYHVGSRPFDFALAPLHPQHPRLLVFAFIGGLLGALGYYLFALSRLLIRGVPLSHETLVLAGFNSCGSLSRYCQAPVEQLGHSDLEAVRRLAQFLIQLEQPSMCCAILGGKNPNFSSTLAELLAMQNRRVLLIHYVFDQPVHAHESPGLWHYLQGEVQQLPIRRRQGFDFVSSGGTTRHSVEYLSHPQMKACLADAKGRYDIILLYSTAKPTDVEGEALLNIADALIIGVQGEKKEELLPYQAWSETKEKTCVAYVDLDAEIAVSG